jgi:uncharacterized protein YbjQ (UPF0145 family)
MILEEFETSKAYWLRRPGPTGGLKQSDALQKHQSTTFEELEQNAQALGAPLIVQFIKEEDGKIGKWFKLEIEETPQTHTINHQQHHPTQPQQMHHQQPSFEMMRLQMEIDRLKGDQSRTVDTHWLQNEVQRLNAELSTTRKEALERERAAYAKGKEDAEDSAGGEGFSIKEMLPILEKMKQAPQQTQHPQQQTQGDQGPSLKELFALVITKAIEPKNAPGVIKTLFGENALQGIKANREQIFTELIADPELANLANGETPEIIEKLNEALQNA